MKNVKLCPLRKINGKTFDHCYKEKCAWYDKNYEQCAIWVIAHELTEIKWQLREGVVTVKP